jgi:hypothetical protein
MSVGEVIVIGEVTVSVTGVGFQWVDVYASDLIVDRSWREVIGEPWPVGPAVRTIVADLSTSPSAVVRPRIAVEGFGM